MGRVVKRVTYTSTVSTVRRLSVPYCYLTYIIFRDYSIYRNAELRSYSRGVKRTVKYEIRFVLVNCSCFLSHTAASCSGTRVLPCR